MVDKTYAQVIHNLIHRGIFVNVLSLFDGMSCGQIALDQLGIKVDNYYASEIDQYAIQIAKKNYPNTIHIGDVTKIKASDLPKIDLLIGGSPCQGFSFAGKQLNFNDPRSALFFEYVRLLRECKPKYFLLENVRMKQEYQDVISEHLGVKPIILNSSLVSAQNRVRLYWTNILVNSIPEDKRIVLKDILEETPNNYVKMSNTFTERQKGNRCLTDLTQPKANNLSAMEYVKNGRQGNYIACNNYGSPIQIGIADNINGHDILKRIYSSEGKSPTLNAHGGGNTEPKVAILQKPRGNNKGGYRAVDGKTPTLTSNSWEHNNFVVREKSKTVRASGRGSYDRHEWDSVGNKNSELYYRKLTPTECERLQTVPDGYTEGVSNTQRYKMLGNGWTIEIIKHLLKELKHD